MQLTGEREGTANAEALRQAHQQWDSRYSKDVQSMLVFNAMKVKRRNQTGSKEN